MTLSKLYKLSEHQFPHLKMGIVIVPPLRFIVRCQLNTGIKPSSKLQLFNKCWLPLVVIAYVPDKKDLNPKQIRSVFCSWQLFVQYSLTTLSLLNFWLYLDEPRVELSLPLSDLLSRLVQVRNHNSWSTYVPFSWNAHRSSRSIIFK